MSDGKGWPVVVKLNLPPVAQFASGNSVIIQGDNGDEVAAGVDSLTGVEGHGRLILAAIVEKALAQAVEVTLGAPEPAKPTAEQKKAAAVSKAMKAKADKAAAETHDAKAENLARPVSSGEEMAAPALLKVVASKTGKTVEELGALTKAQAKSLLK